MTKVMYIASARRPMSVRRSQRSLARDARSREMPLCLEAIEGRQEDELVTTIIHAIDLAKSCRSSTTVYLLKMALLNEGVRVADSLREETHLWSVNENHHPCPI